MSTILRVQWIIEPSAAPKPHLPCAQCRQVKPFCSSGKFRLNANGKRLDAWLIYRCVDCDGTWKRPIFERQPVGAVDPARLDKLRANNAALATTIAFDTADLRRYAPRIEHDSEVAVTKRLGEQVDCWTTLEITMIAPLTVSTRLDRLVARELGLSRERVKALVAERRLRVDSDGWRRAVRNGDRVEMDANVGLVP